MAKYTGKKEALDPSPSQHVYHIIPKYTSDPQNTIIHKNNFMYMITKCIIILKTNTVTYYMYTMQTNYSQI